MLGRRWHAKDSEKKMKREMRNMVITLYSPQQLTGSLARKTSPSPLLKAMEATLCLRPLNASATKLHCLLTVSRQNANPRHGPVFSHCTVRSVPNTRYHPLLMRANVPLPPPVDGGIRMTKRGNKVVGARAAMALACFVGVFCLKLKGGKLANASTFGWSIGKPSSPHVTACSQFPGPGPAGLPMNKSFDALLEIFKGVEPTTLLELLKEQIGEDKYGKGNKKLLETGKEGDQVAGSLLTKWESMPTSHEKCELGLLLIDIFIYQGKNEKAKYIGRVLKGIVPPSDMRFLLRKNIVNVMLAVDNILLTDALGQRIKETDETKHTKKWVAQITLEHKINELAIPPLTDDE